MRRVESVNLRDQLVQFRIRDVYLPDPQAVTWKLHADDLLRGRVVDLSRHTDGQLFAVVEVEGVGQALVVPADHLDAVAD